MRLYALTVSGSNLRLTRFRRLGFDLVMHPCEKGIWFAMLVCMCMHAYISIAGMTVYVYRVAWKWHTAVCMKGLPLLWSICPHGLASAMYMGSDLYRV